MSAKYTPKSALGRAVHSFEETAIAVILGVMTVITFINVVLRYVFNSTLIWGLEATLILFAWLVLFGMSYAVKVTAHLGVDAVIGALSRGPRRALALLAAALCIIYAFGGFQQTGGRWFPEGFINTRDQAWYETESLPMPDWLRFIEPIFNEGERYTKVPRFIPYFILPFGCALLLVRLIEATIGLIRGKRDALIVSHEAEDAIEDVRHLNAED